MSPPSPELGPPPPTPLQPGAPRLARSGVFIIFPPLSRPPPLLPEPLHSSEPPPQPPLRSALRLHPASLIIASFSQRQIVRPQDAPEDFRPLTNGLLIFYQKGRGKGG